MQTLTTGTPWKKILAFMLPVFAGLLLQRFYNIVDTIIVGNFAGEAALASVGACGILTMVFLALANGFSAGAGILISQLYGGGKKEDLRSQASSSILMMLGMGVIASIIALGISRYALAYIFETPMSLLGDADLYFKIYALGLIFQFDYNIVAAILRGVGDSKATLYFLLIASVMNIGLDILFVYNLQMGVKGAAIATDLAQAASCIAALIYMMKQYPEFNFQLREWRFEWDLALKSLRVGFPMALQQFIVSFGFTFIQRAVNSYGETMTASFSVAYKVETMMTLPANSLMVTQGTYTGQNIGAERLDRVKLGVKQTVIQSEIISIILIIVVYSFAEPIVNLFGIGPDAAVYCVAHIRFITLCLIPFAAYFPLLGVFQGANDALYSTFVATSALAMRVVSTYVLKEVPQIGYHMIWWNAAFGWGLGFIITWLHYFRGKWNRITHV